MDKKTKDILGYAASAALAAALLWFSFRGIGWEEFRRGLRVCAWEYVAAAMGFGILSFWLRGLRWRELLLPTDPSLRRLTCFNAVNVSYMANMVLPRVGELVRCAYVSRRSAPDAEGRRRASFDKVLGTVVVDRVWDTLTLVLLLLVMVLTMGGRFAALFSGGMTAGAGTFLLPGAILVSGLAALAVLRMLRDRNAVFRRLWAFVAGIFQGMASCLRMEGRWKFLLQTVLVWVCYWMTCHCILMAVQGRLPGFDALTAGDSLLLMVVGSVSSVVPVPGGFGAYHYLISLALANLYGIPASYGLIWATLNHESQALAQIVCGTGSWICETLRKDEFDGTVV